MGQIHIQKDSKFRCAQLYGEKFDENGVIIQVFGKTGSRRIRPIESERFLRNWLQDHPSEEEKAPLWVKPNNTKVNTRNFAKMRLGEC